MPVTLRFPTVVRVAAGLALLLIVVLLAWIGGEIHYRNCLSEVQLNYGSGSANSSNDFGGAARSKAIDRCSRFP